MTGPGESTASALTGGAGTGAARAGAAGAHPGPTGQDSLAEEPRWLERPPEPARGELPALPETFSYRLKRRMLGRALTTEDLHSERLGKPVALAVLSSDVMSSCAYGSESVLRVLIPAAGLGAFVLVVPVTGLLLLVLGLVCLCYRQVVATYPVSGGSYVVSRENFGFTVAQIPGAALLLSYVLTVAVSVAAGVDAVISAFPALSSYPVELSVAFIVLLTYGNLRGIREAGRIFAVPTYWFFASMGVLVVVGIVRAVTGHIAQYPLHAAGHIQIGQKGSGILFGASLFLFLRGFANGGSAMTGMEAISNAVPVFKDPTVRNARTTLALMATILGAMFLSVSIFAALTHAVPFVSGTPTVLSEVGRSLFGHSTAAKFGFYSLQFSTALILVLGANTSFNGFPLLVNFIAQDSYLPRPFRTRGHRLVYSNGVCVLAVVSIVLLVVTDAKVSALIPLYACTVFTGFTMAGIGMTKYHLTHDSPNRRRKLLVAGATFVAAAITTLIFVVTEFTHGAWLVVVCIPLIIFVLTRTHRRYVEEGRVLAEDSAAAETEPPMLRHHVVLVLVDSVDLATSRAVQLARSLSLSAEVRAVHFVLDAARAERMVERWGKLGHWQISLELVECPDRRLTRAAAELAAELAADGETEVTLVLPRRIYKGLGNRLLHSNTADRIVAAVSTIPNVSATVAPFDVAAHLRQREREERRRKSADPAGRRDRDASKAPPSPQGTAPAGEPGAPEGATPISALEYRKRSRIAGRIRAVRVQPWSGVQALECTVVDGSGAVNIVFLGRRAVPGLEVGTKLTAEGMVGRHDGRLAIINPSYELIKAAPRETPSKP